MVHSAALVYFSTRVRHVLFIVSKYDVGNDHVPGEFLGLQTSREFGSNGMLEQDRHKTTMCEGCDLLFLKEIREVI